MHRRFALLATTALALGSPWATAPARAQDRPLTIGVAAPVTSIDPHYYNASPNNSMAQHIFDRLIERSAKVELRPMLAESWTPVGETTWEFKLRAGVKWHDGRDFTAEDVAFTVARAPDVPGSPGGFGGLVRAIRRTEIVDPLTVRFHTERPHPLLPIELSSVPVISKHAGEGAATEDYNSGKAAIGTGPYRLVSHRQGDRTELARNDSYWGGRQPWSRVTYRFIANDGARTAAALAGDVDIIDQVPSGDVPRLRREARLQLSEIESLRVIYLMADFSREGEVPGVTDNDGKPLARNPLRDVRVRQALNVAINRQALVEQVMEGAAKPTGQWLPEGSFSYNAEVKAPAQDLDAARRLLAEAGFPQGFRLTLSTPNDRYPNDAKTAQAVAQMWTRAGVRTQVDALPWASFAGRSNRQEFGMRLIGWGSFTGEASYMLVNIMNTYDQARRTGASNAGRYSDPALDALTERAAATLDDRAREGLLREAVAKVAADLPIIPLHQLVNVWAVKRGLVHEPRMDELTVAMGVRPAP